MSEYDFEGEALAAGNADLNERSYPNTFAALRRAYAAGQASGTINLAVPQTSTDLDRLVTLAAGHHGWCTTAPVPFPEIADDCQLMLTALKAQAVAK